jgi:peptide/nickel transport system permease protein
MSMVEATAAELNLSGVGDEPTVGRWKEVRSRLVRNPSAVVGAVLIALFVIAAVFAPLLAPYSPIAADLSKIRPGFVPGPSSAHWLGLDTQGRDELSRILFGARSSLLVGVVAVAIGGAGGLAIGTLAGAFGGWVDNACMRLMDIMLAVPSLLFAIGLAEVLGRSLRSVEIAIGVVNVPQFARLLRGQMLGQRGSEYVVAARSIGVTRRRIVFSHVLPNSLTPVIVAGTLALATAIIDVAGLAFLGLGSNDPSVPEWGRMLVDTQQYLQSSPQLAMFPGLAIVVSVLGFNLLGDALREALDPKIRK